jgi:hypothetical protein
MATLVCPVDFEKCFHNHSKAKYFSAVVVWGFFADGRELRFERFRVNVWRCCELLNPVYTIQSVGQPVGQPVGQQVVSCIRGFTYYMLVNQRCLATPAVWQP